MVFLSRRTAWLLLAFGVWSWIIWPTFLKNIWADNRSWNHGMTAFFAVHLALTVVSLTLGTIIGVLGIRALTITVNGRPVAEIGPVRSLRPPFFAKADLLTLLDHQADAGLSGDLDDLAGDTTDDLDPL